MPNMGNYGLIILTPPLKPEFMSKWIRVLDVIVLCCKQKDNTMK